MAAAAAFAGAIFAIRPFAAATLPLIITPDDSLNFQGVIDGLPVPRLLDWNVGQIEQLIDIRAANGPVVWIFAILLVVVVWMRAAAVFDPAFRLFGTAPKHMDGTEAPFPTTLDARLLRRSLTGFACAFLLIVAVSAAARAILARLHAPMESEHVLLACQIAAFGAGLFAAGRYTSVGSLSVVRNAVFGAAFGLSAYGLYRLAMPLPSNEVLRSYHMLGNFNRAYWSDICVRYLSSAAGIWFAASLLFYVLARPDLSKPQRIAIGSAAILIAYLAHQPGRKFDAAAFASRRDITPVLREDTAPYNPNTGRGGVPDGPEAAEMLARILKLAQDRHSMQPGRDLLLFYPRGPIAVRQHGFTEDMISGDVASAERVERFLETRKFETAMSWIALKHIFNVAAIHFDTAGMMRALLLDLERCPHLEQCNPTLRAMLFICASTPQNLQVLNEWADTSRFAYPTRDSIRLIGDLYLRFGETRRALQWYRRADMPRSFIARIRQERPLFHTGEVQGVLEIDGRPVAGVQVAVAPKRLNGLPRDLEVQVLEADRDLAGRPWSNSFGFGFPRPFAFRWLSAAATTNSQGEFQIGSLTEGEYSLICSLPTGYHLPVGPMSAGSVRNAPARFTLNYSHTMQNLGVVNILINR